MVGELSFKQWLGVLSGATAVVGPSTSVVHLSAAMGVPTIGLYSPIRVQRAKRWGPRGVQVIVHEPTVLCPASSKCLGADCPFFDCMELLV